MQDINKIIKDLFSRQRAGIKPGLERTLQLLNFLGNPHENLKCIHIAGTNGKGTVSSILASYYTELGKKVGLYTSPHILEFNERIRINGIKIPDEYLINTYSKLIDLVEEIDATFFEITTVIAFSYFAENDCDICIIETGMGGRFDSTNVIDPIMSIITSISFDHKEFLGDTIEKIAFEKAGIIKKNKPVVIGKLDENAMKVMHEKINNENAEFIEIDNVLNKLKLIDEEEFIANYEFEGISFETSLIGNHNKINLSIIISGLKKLGDFDLDKFINSLSKIRSNTGYFGRLSVVRRNPFLILDTAHNEEGIQNNINTIKNNTDKKFSVVYTGMKDKDNRLNLNLLKEICNELVLTKTSQIRNESLENLNKISHDLGYENIKTTSNLDEAMNYILNSNKDCLVIGSFFLVSEAILSLKELNQGSIGLDVFSNS